MRCLPFALIAVSFVAADPKAYAPDDGRYSVRFPGAPREQAQASKTAVGEIHTKTATYALADGTVLAVSYTDYPPAAARNGEAVLLGARDGLKGADGNLLADAADPFGKGQLPSRTVLVDKGKLVVRARLVVKGERLFQVTAVGSKEAVKGDAADAFFESFALGE